jgi:hypothetical protein
MEDDSAALFGPRPEKIGEIFIPPARYALPGTHEYTVIQVGDGGRCEVTYEITASLQVDYALHPAELVAYASVGSATIGLTEIGSPWNGNESAPWTGSANDDWLSVTPAAGTVGTEVQVSFTENLSG